MPDPLWWQMTRPVAAPPVKPPVSDLRPCGCSWDVIVFGHCPAPYRGGGCGGDGDA